MVTARIVGREHEFAVARRLVDGLPTGGVLVAAGEPGVGKTTLLDVVHARAEAAGAVVVRMSADEFSAARPLGLVRADAGPDGYDGDDVLAHLEQVAAGRPCVVLLDDLQWADPTSLALLGPVVRRGVPAGLVFVLAHRSWPRNPALDELLDRIAPLSPELLTLPPLSPAEIQVLAELRLGRPPSRAVNGLLSQTGGNPFYALSLLNMLEAEGVIDRSGSVAELRGLPPAVDRSSLATLVVRRVALLGPQVERTLQHASVLGRSFSLRLLADLVGSPVESVGTDVEHAVRAEVLRADGALLTFRHDLLHEALAASVAAPVRMLLHRRAAELLQAVGEVSATGGHLLRAEVGPADVDWLRSTAEHCSPSVGLALLERALELLDDGSDAGRLAVERADLLLWNGRADEAVETAHHLLATGLDGGRPVQVRAIIAHALFLLGRADEAVDSWVPVPPGAPPEVRAGEAAELSFASMFAGRLADARRRAEVARHLADDDTSATIASVVLAFTAAAAGDAADALAHADTAVARAEGAGDDARRVGPRVMRAAVRDFVGDTTGALDDLMADENGSGTDRGSVVRVPFRLAVTAITHFRSGRWDDALATAEAGLQAVDDLRVAVVDGWLCAVPMLTTLFRNGPAATAPLRRPSGHGSLGGDWMLWAQALVLDAEGDSSEAFDLLHLVATAATAMGSGTAALQVTPDLVRLARQLGETARAAEVLELVRWAERVDDGVPSAAEYRWAVALHRADASGVTAAAERLAAVRPFAAARAERDAALLLAESEADSATTRAAATRAIARFEALGADDAIARLRADLRARGCHLRVGKPGTQRVGWAAVTATERMVVELVAAGLTNGEIASRLYTSRRTVESHLVHVYTKVGVKSRVELARAASHEWGLAAP